MKNLLIMPLIFVCFIISCDNNNRKKSKDYFLLDIENSIYKKPSNKLTINEISNEINIIPVKTNDSTLFDNLFIAGVTDKEIISYEKKALYSIDKKNGAVKTILNNQGTGPEEYKDILDVIIEEDSIIYI